MIVSSPRGLFHCLCHHLTACFTNCVITWMSVSFDCVITWRPVLLVVSSPDALFHRLHHHLVACFTYCIITSWPVSLIASSPGGLFHRLHHHHRLQGRTEQTEVARIANVVWRPVSVCCHARTPLAPSTAAGCITAGVCVWYWNKQNSSLFVLFWFRVWCFFWYKVVHQAKPVTQTHSRTHARTRARAHTHTHTHDTYTPHTHRCLKFQCQNVTLGCCCCCCYCCCCCFVPHP